MIPALCLIIASLQVGSNWISGNILSQSDSLAIPYATVGIVGTTAAVFANEQGFFKIVTAPGDSLEIMAPGYEPVKYVASFIPEKIYLQPRKISLQEISVVANKKVATTGTAAAKTIFVSSSNIGVEFALRLKLEANRPKQLQKVIIRAKHTSSVNLIRLHLYKVDEDGLPGEELLPQTILLNDYYIRRKKLEIDLQLLNLHYNEPYIFVGIEWVGSNDKTRGIEIGFTDDKLNEMPCFTRSTKGREKWSETWVPFAVKMEGYVHPVPQISIEYKY